MGHSITCNFQVNVNLNNGVQVIYGAMSLKDVKGLMLTEKEYQSGKGIEVKNAEIWAQTKSGERYLKGYSFLLMDMNFTIKYMNWND